MLVGGRSAMGGLTLVGSNLYWVEDQSGIFSVPVTGGMAKSVYANPNINQALGTDGTLLYFTQTSGTGSEVDSVGLDGTGEQALATGVFDLSAENNAGPQIFVVNGVVYVNGTGNIYTITPAADGGAAEDGGTMGTVLTGTTEVQSLLWADASGIYFTDFGGSVYWVALAGGPGTAIYTSSSIGSGAPPGDLTVVGGTAYFLLPGSATQTAQLMKSTAGATATVVASYSMENANRAGIAADGNGGLYELVGGDLPGIYGAPVSSGTQTAVDTSTSAINIINMSGDLHAVDAQNIYYGVVGGSVFSIWAHAR
jgi:hypothetical protein